MKDREVRLPGANSGGDSAAVNRRARFRRCVLWAALLALSAAAAAGCHNPLRNPLIDTTIVNQGPALQLLELDYPNASFGSDALAAGGEFHHSFAIEGSGPLTLHFVDAAGKSHTAQGPAVRDGEGGSLLVTIDRGSAIQWKLNLDDKK